MEGRAHSPVSPVPGAAKAAVRRELKPRGLSLSSKRFEPPVGHPHLLRPASERRAPSRLAWTTAGFPAPSGTRLKGCEKPPLGKGLPRSDSPAPGPRREAADAGAPGLWRCGQAPLLVLELQPEGQASAQRDPGGSWSPPQTVTGRRHLLALLLPRSGGPGAPGAPERKLLHTAGALVSVAATLDCLALMARGACVPGSHTREREFLAGRHPQGGAESSA